MTNLTRKLAVTAALCLSLSAAVRGAEPFTDIGAGLVGAGSYESSLAWGDYDNDGDLDLAVVGSSSSGPASRIYRNEGGTFTDIGAGLTGVWLSSLAWGDYDNDGDLDLVLAGNDGGNQVNKLYSN